MQEQIELAQGCPLVYPSAGMGAVQEGLDSNTRSCSSDPGCTSTVIVF